MAQFNADILFTASNKAVLDKIAQIENAVNRLGKKVNDISVKTTKGIKINLDDREAIQKIRQAETAIAKLQNKLSKPTKLANIEAAVSGSAPLAGKDVKAQADSLRRAAEIQERIIKSVTAESNLRKNLQALTDKQAKLLDVKAQRIQRNLEKRRQASEEAKKELAIDKEALEVAARRERLENKKRSIAGARGAQQRRQRFREDLALGAGFPLLFGGGIGSVGGGLLGSIAGQGKGGFGLQILFSALGQQLDQFAKDVGDLGKALNPLTADVNKVAEAAGLTGTKLGKLISELEQAGNESKALELATSQLADVVGNDGVEALRKFGEQAQEFSNILQRELTRLKAAFAGAFTLPEDLQQQATRGDLLTQARSSQNRDVQAAVRERDFLSTQVGIGVSPDEVVAAEEKILALLKEINAQREKEAQLALITSENRALEAAAIESNLAKAENTLAISRIAGGLENEKVFQLQLQSIELEKIEAINANIQDLYDGQITRLQAIKNQQAINATAEAARNNLIKQRNELIARLDKKAAGKAAPQSQAAALQQQIVREELKRLDIRAKALELTKGEEAALKYQNSEITTRLQKETQIVELQRQQALERNKIPGEAAQINQVYDERLKTLTQELQLQYAQNNERLRAIALERELADIKAEQELGGLRTDLTREIEDAQFRTANPFGGDRAEQMELATAQARRYMDVMKEIEDQEELLKKRIERGALGRRAYRYKQTARSISREEKTLRRVTARYRSSRAARTQDDANPGAFAAHH